MNEQNVKTLEAIAEAIHAQETEKRTRSPREGVHYRLNLEFFTEPARRVFFTKMTQLKLKEMGVDPEGLGIPGGAEDLGIPDSTKRLALPKPRKVRKTRKTKTRGRKKSK